MKEISFDAFVEAIAKPAYSPKGKADLSIASSPEPFVSPPLVAAPDQKLADPPYNAEIIFVRASAAVGKSTMASYLSARQQLPLLDLAEVPVATGTLRALISSLTGPSDPVKAFQSGKIPIVIDALDEGRLLSGETGFESFLKTTGELLLEDRIVTNRPKLIVFGRFDSVDLATIGLEIYGEDVTTSTLNVDFFRREQAWEVIHAYAKSTADQDAPYRRHPKPVNDLINAYFEAIESSLGLDENALWENKQGRAFAGYAPVLAAIGAILAKMENFKEVVNSLRSAGELEAWDVIETVLQEILDREKGKLCDKLSTQLAGPLPNEVYDRDEQLRFLTQHVHGQPLSVSGRVRMSPADQAKYTAMVEQYVCEHPFVRDRDFVNVVLGSVVLAYAVHNDLLQNVDVMSRLAEYSRQPFLWRAIRPYLKDKGLIDGRYVGCLLSSFWNDPLADKPRVVISGAGEDDADALVVIPSYCGSKIEFKIAMPLTLSGQGRMCNIDVSGTVKLEGYSSRGSASLFDLHGPATIICDSMEVTADVVTLDREIWLEAETMISQPKLLLRPKENAKVGWGRVLSSKHPWNRLSSTLPPPYEVEPQDLLGDLLETCWQRLPESVGVLTLKSDFTVPGDRRMGWVERWYPKAFPKLISLMVEHKLARAETMSASGTQKTRVHFEVSWAELREAVKSPSSAPDPLPAFIEAASKAIG